MEFGEQIPAYSVADDTQCHFVSDHGYCILRMYREWTQPRDHSGQKIHVLFGHELERNAAEGSRVSSTLNQLARVKC